MAASNHGDADGDHASNGARAAVGSPSRIGPAPAARATGLTARAGGASAASGVCMAATATSSLAGTPRGREEGCARTKHDKSTPKKDKHFLKTGTGSTERQAGTGAMEGRHPPYADMAVEAVQALGHSRGSSLSAMAIWIRNSRDGALLANAGASAKEFKATVSVGVKQASPAYDGGSLSS